MKKVLILFFCGALGFSQELPEIITPTPEAATLGKYGNTPVGKYTGVTQISIPLYTISEGDITVPITLNYHAGGFKVQEDATWVGLGWSLSAGGMISRDPRGNPDKFNRPLSGLSSWGSNNYLPENFISLQDNMYVPNGTDSPFDVFGIERVFTGDEKSHKLMEDMEPYFLQVDINNPSGGYGEDVIYQPDHFNYSFPGASGEFYNKDDANLIDMSKNLLKIEKGYNSDNYSFKITDTKGAIYKYGNPSLNLNLGGIERTTHLSFTPNGPVAPPSVDMNWLLSSITSKTGRIVNFFYENSNAGDLTYSAISIKAKKKFSQGVAPVNTDPNYNLSTIESQSRTQKSVLSKIEFSQGYVLFSVNDTSNPREDILGDGAKKLEAIEIYRYTDNPNNATLVKKIVFEYSYFVSTSTTGAYNPSSYFQVNNASNSKRLRLDRIKEYGTDVNAEPKIHEFAYNNVQLPKKTSYSVDKYGYYNGSSNSTFIHDQIIFGVSYPGADVTINPGFIDACLLEKITYPTKGSTEFNYEPNEYYTGYTLKKLNLRTEANYSGGYDNLTIYPETRTFTIDEPTTIQFDISLVGRNSSINPVDLYAQISRSDGQYFRKWDYSIYTDSNAENYCEVYTDGSGHLPDQSCAIKESINLPTGTYTITTHNNIDDIAVPTSDGNVLSIASVKISYWYKDYTDNSEYGPGVRIAKIVDKGFDNEIISHKLFTYSKSNGGSSGRILHNPYFYYTIYENPDNQVGQGTYKNYRTNTPKRSFSTSANGKLLGYDRVSEVSIDSFDEPNGKVVSEFYNHQDFFDLDGYKHGTQNAVAISSPLNGMLKKQEVFKSESGGGFTISKRSSNDYKVQQSDIYWYPEDFKLDDGDLYGPGRPFGTVFLKCLYPEISTFVALESTTEEVFDTDDENNPITTTTNYLYDNTQLSSEAITHSNNKIQTNHYYYPLSNSYLPISAAKPSWVNFPQSMIDKNMVGSPIVTATEIDSEITAITATDYKLWHAKNVGTTEDDIVMPEEIKTVKASQPTQDRIVYHDYDTYGNPLEVSKADGPPISYIWGYNEKYPVAKIEHATHTNAIATLTSTELANIKAGTYSQSTMITVLNKIRTGLPNAMVTTYTYDPLIGVTSMTDPRGYTMYYEYDDFNRLEFVKDADGNLISENKYNYKDQ